MTISYFDQLPDPISFDDVRELDRKTRSKHKTNDEKYSEFLAERSKTFMYQADKFLSPEDQLWFCKLMKDKHGRK